MMGQQVPVLPGSAQRSAAAAAMHAGTAYAAPDGTATPIAEVPPPPFEFEAPPPPLPGLEQPCVASLAAATQSSAESMAKEVANIKASFDSGQGHA